MLTHLHEKPISPSRVVVLGMQGFVASHILRQLKSEGIAAIGLSKKEVNLLDDNAASMLLEHLKAGDSLVMVSAIAPCKNNALLLDNLKMMKAVTDTLDKVSLAHIVYISSDAVYADDVTLASESSVVQPSTMHGMMHSARELMLKTSVGKTPLAILRPSLLYGLDDPHNGYGPNRFRRFAQENKSITLFGEGEEKRDHIAIEDVAKIVTLTLKHGSQGVLNIATGESHSFNEIAKLAVTYSGNAVSIQGTPRQNPITHRHFDTTACHKAFPLFKYIALEDGLKKIMESSKETAHV